MKIKTLIFLFAAILFSGSSFGFKNPACSQKIKLLTSFEHTRLLKTTNTNDYHQVVKILFEEQNFVLLIRRNEEPYKNHWDLPGGHIEKGETIKDASQRELREELGVHINNLQLERRIQFQIPDFSKPFKVHLIKASLLGTYIGPLDRNEVADYEWFSRDALPEMIIPFLKLVLEKPKSLVTMTESLN